MPRPFRVSVSFILGIQEHFDIGITLSDAGGDQVFHDVVAACIGGNPADTRTKFHHFCAHRVLVDDKVNGVLTDSPPLAVFWPVAGS